MSELKEIGIRWEENGELHFSHVYRKSDVDTVIEEKDRAIEFAKALTLKDIEIIKEKDKEIAELKAENERLKEMMPKYDRFIKDEKFKKKLTDEYDGYVYEWMGHSYIATPYINVFIKGILRALWLSRVNRALEKIAWFKLWNASISTMNPEDGARQEFDKWKKALGKFLAKE